LAKANLEKVHKRYKDFADKSRREVKFQEGDEVWLKIKNFRLPEGLSHKFLGPYVGPFKLNVEGFSFWMYIKIMYKCKIFSKVPKIVIYLIVSIVFDFICNLLYVAF
jgi:hypothetical protein